MPVPFTPSSSNVPEIMKSNITTFSASHNKGEDRATTKRTRHIQDEEKLLTEPKKLITTAEKAIHDRG